MSRSRFISGRFTWNRLLDNAIFRYLVFPGVVLIAMIAIAILAAAEPEIQVNEVGQQLTVHITTHGYAHLDLEKYVNKKLNQWLKDHPGAALERQLDKERRIGEGEVCWTYTIYWDSAQ